MRDSAHDPAPAPDAATVVAALGQLISPERAARIDDVLRGRLHGLRLVLEDLHDPHNGAAALRSIEALGLGVVHVIEGAERFRFSPKVTQGCERWIQLVRHSTPSHCVTALKREGFRLYGAVPGAALTVADLPVDEKVAILVGNEHAGLTAEARAGCDGEVGLPLYGMTRSFNLSVAVALLVSQTAERRRRLLGHRGDLDPTELLALRARWYKADVRGADEIVARYVREHRLDPTTR
jgi:tRNA (guanosine-2'-O-)-methyltransferase